MAIAKPRAIQQLVRGPNGVMQMVYVDPTTGRQVSNPTGYNVTQNNDMNLNFIDPLKDETPKPKEKEIVSPQIEQQPRVGSDHVVDPRDNQIDPRDVTNNFGYTHKPGWVSLTSALPGMLGIAGKAVNAGFNANNMTAANEARKMMGIPEFSGWESVKGVVKNNQGQVADVKIGQTPYSVGFEALSPTGATNLTPDEANKRANITNQDINLLSQDEVDAKNKKFEDSFPEASGGLLSGLRNDISSFFDHIFGGSSDKTPGGFSLPDKAPTPTPNPRGLAGGGRDGGTVGPSSIGNDQGTGGTEGASKRSGGIF